MWKVNTVIFNNGYNPGSYVTSLLTPPLLEAHFLYTLQQSKGTFKGFCIGNFLFRTNIHSQLAICLSLVSCFSNFCLEPSMTNYPKLQIIPTPNSCTSYIYSFSVLFLLLFYYFAQHLQFTCLSYIWSVFFPGM